MDFNATIDLIIKELDDARKIIDDLKKYPGVPLLQVELAKSKCKSAGEVISLLKEEEGNQKTEVGNPKTEDESRKTEDGSEIKKDSHGKKMQESHIIGDSFTHLSNKLSDQLGTRKDDNDLSGIIKNKPLSSLTEAIGINDRFLFIREIFNGDNEAYSQAVSRLEKAESIQDARAIILSYTGETKENEAIKQLLDLVKRKLP